MAREHRNVGSVRSRERGGRVQWRLEFRRLEGGREAPKVRVYAWPAAGTGRRRPFRDEEDAREALALIRAELARGRPLLAALEPWMARVAPESLLLARAERWLAHVRGQVEAGDRSPTYVRELERYVRQRGYWASWWEGREVHGITYGDLEDWVAWLAREGGRGSGLSAKTRQQVLGAFRTFLRWLKRRHEIDELPEFPSIEVDEYAPKIIDIATQERVLEQIPWPRRGAFLVCRLGVRPGEVRAINIGDFTVDPDGRPWLRVAHGMKGPNSAAPRRGPKERKIRTIPLDDAAADWVRWRIEGRAAAMARGKPAWLLSAALFPNPTGRRDAHRWLSNALRLEWNRAEKPAGVQHVKMYEGTKHSFATDAVARGVPLEWVQKFLGHADRRSTERYARLAPAGLVAVLRR